MSLAELFRLIRSASSFSGFGVQGPSEGQRVRISPVYKRAIPHGRWDLMSLRSVLRALAACQWRPCTVDVLRQWLDGAPAARLEAVEAALLRLKRHYLKMRFDVDSAG